MHGILKSDISIKIRKWWIKIIIWSWHSKDIVEGEEKNLRVITANRITKIRKR